MAYDPTYYDFGRAETPLMVAKELDREVRERSNKFDPDSGLAGTGKNAIFQVDDQLTKTAGDSVTFVFKWLAPIATRPIIGNESSEGRAQGIHTSTWNLKLNKSRWVTRDDGEMNNQRVHFDTLAEGKDTIATQVTSQQELACQLHLSGASNVTDLAFTHHNAPTAPDADHILYPTGITTDQAITSGAYKFNLGIINRLVTRAKTLSPRIRPGKILGGEYYVLFIHPDVTQTLREAGSDWHSLFTRVLQGGEWQGNPIFTGALGIIDNVILIEDQFVTPGIHSSTGAWVSDVRRCVFGGAGMFKYIFGRGNAPGGYRLNRYRWVSESKDGGDKVESTASTIAGMGCPRFQNPAGTTVDLAKIVVPVYAPVEVAETWWDDLLAA